MELGEPADAAVRDRRTIADDGLIVVVVALDEQNGHLVSDPEVVLRGVPLVKSEDEVLRILCEAAIVACESASDHGETDRDEIARRVHDKVASAANKQLKRRPLVIPVVVQA